MSKAVVCILVATALVLLTVLFQNSSRSYKQHHKPRSLSRRLGSNSWSPIFDPLVVKAERKKEQNASSKSTGSKAGNEGDKKYYNNDGTLNTSLRLMVLFPFLDVAPQDGKVDSKELVAWLMQQAVDRLHDRTRRELELCDKDGDGAVSFFEYLPKFTDADLERNETIHGGAGWWMEQFKNADLDRNGTLNLYEFRDFLHPEDSRNEQIQRWLLREKIRLMDKDGDHKLNFLEFENGAYNTYKTYYEHETGGEYVPTPIDAFNKLDIDRDRLLRIEELKPIIQYLSPGELAYSKYYSIYLINEADENSDGKLTLEEMLNHEHVFYNSVYENRRDDDYHDEL